MSRGILYGKVGIGSIEYYKENVSLSENLLRGISLVHGFLNLCRGNLAKELSLLSNFLKDTQNLFVSTNEAKLGISHPLLLSELFDELTRTCEIMSREAREQVMCDLKMQAPMEKGK